jgi:hypothetical protein
MCDGDGGRDRLLAFGAILSLVVEEDIIINVAVDCVNSLNSWGTEWIENDIYSNHPSSKLLKV